MPSRFSAGEVLNRTFEVYFRNIGGLLAIGLVAYIPMYLFELATTGQTLNSNAGPLVGMLMIPLMIVLIYIMQGAVVYGVYQSLSRRPLVISDSLNVALGRLGALIGVSIVAGFLQFVASLLLIIPGIMVACALWVVVPAVVVERLGVGASLSRSQELTQGYRLRIFGIMIVIFFVSVLIVLVLTFVGAMAMSAGVPIWLSMLFNTVVQAVVATLSAVSTTVGYYHLRMDVEGVDLNQLASVFE